MSELLDAFDDAGLLDVDTRTFLVEALIEAEATEWQDILEPFVTPTEPALKVLEEVPNVLQRSLRALAEAAVAPPEQAVDPLFDLFMQALPTGVLHCTGLHTAAQCARLCKAARTAAADSETWRRRTQAAIAAWALPAMDAPPSDEDTWRNRYLSLLRPRCDGIYVGECGYNRWLPVGHHIDMRKNAAALMQYGGRGGQAEWIGYRRYLRLLPRDPIDGKCWAFVLQDPCPRASAEKVLLQGVDPLSHENPAKPEGVMTDTGGPDTSDAHRLRKLICVGQYAFLQDNRQIEVTYTAGGGEYRQVFELSQSPQRHSDRLTWDSYTWQEANGEVENFNLGRLPEWKGGGLADENKDHFAQMHFRPKLSVEHML